MGDFERKKIDSDLRIFTTRNFVSPTECRNLEQVRFYVRELCLKIEELETDFNYVPSRAYTLLSQYNVRQNAIINCDFKHPYSMR